MTLLPPPLEDILLGKGHGPFSLEQFATYLESFHCVENLEFILGIKRIIHHLEPTKKPRTDEDIQRLWNTIYNNFLLESSEKEVNLPCLVKSELLRYTPARLELPPHTLAVQSCKIIYELLVDSYYDFVKVVVPSSRSNSESGSVVLNLHLGKNFDCLPLLPESFGEIEYENSITNPNRLFKPVPALSFHHFQLDKPESHARPLVLGDAGPNDVSIAYYTLPSALPSPQPLGRRRASEPQSQLQLHQQVLNLQSKEPATNLRSNSTSTTTSNSSRGSSIGSIVDTLKGVDTISWKKAVKKFRIRRFLNEYSSMNEEES